MAKLQVCKKHLTTPLLFQLLNGHLMTEELMAAWQLTGTQGKVLGPTGCGDLGQLSNPAEAGRHCPWADGHNLGQPSQHIQDLTTNILLWILVRAAGLAHCSHPCPYNLFSAH